MLEAVDQRSPVKKLLANFAKIAGKQVFSQVFPCESCEIFTNTLFYRTPLVAASGMCL